MTVFLTFFNIVAALVAVVCIPWGLATLVAAIFDDPKSLQNQMLALKGLRITFPWKRRLFPGVIALAWLVAAHMNGMLF